MGEAGGTSRPCREERAIMLRSVCNDVGAQVTG